MKVKSTLLTILLLAFAQFLFAQSILMTNPPRLDFESNPGYAELQLINEGDTVNWTATIDGDWLTMVPLNGEGSTDLFIEYTENQSPRRVARIVFQAEDGTIDPYTLEIRQFQGMPTIMMPVEFSILEFTHIDDPALMPYTARASFDYQPMDYPLFFSLLVRSNDGDEPAWVIQNLLLPEAYWHDSIQAIASRFDLGLLGFEHGQPVEMLQYSYTLSTEPDTIIPFAPNYSFLDVSPRTSVIRALGRYIDDVHVPDTFLTYWIPDWFLPVDITDKYYIGCSMPNGDLNSGANANDENGCGPAAAANSLKWLMKNHDGINWPTTWHDGFNELATLMEHKNASGVDDADFIRGKLDIIEAYNLPIKVKYQDNSTQGDVKSTSGNSKAECKDATNTSYPTKDWMFSEIKDNEDVEVGITYPSGAGHWVVLTGTHSINGRPGIYYKHDADQDNEDASEVKQEHSWIKEEDGKMKMANEGNAVIDIVVSESFDPDYEAEPSSESFDKYCKSIKRTIAPGRSVTITFPENAARCYNTTVRVLNRDESNSYKKVRTWNHNSGKTRKYKNNTGKVVTVEFHNDDHYDGGLPLFKTYDPFIVDINEIENDVDGVTDPGNPEEYGGFSIGTDDDSSDEFGDLMGPEVTYVDSLGNFLHDFPGKMETNGVQKLTIQHEISVWNRYWGNLGLVIGIDSIAVEGPIKITCPTTGYSETYTFVDAGEYELALGGVTEAGMFELILEIQGDASYFFDNLGIPSLVQIEPIIDISLDDIEFENADAASLTTDILNLGGSDLIWFITNETDWITVDPENGINEGTVTVSCTENTSADERTAELSVTGYNARNSPLTFKVTQPGSTESIGEIKEPEYSLAVYPNPNNGAFDISLQGLKPGNIRIKLTSILGKEVWSLNTQTSESEWTSQIQARNLENGIYFLSVDSDLGLLRKMVFVNK